MENNASIEFSSDELWFLMSRFGPSYVLGMENPHLGWLIEEIEEADHTALESLIKKGIVKIIDAENIDLDNAIAAWIKCCTHPEHTLIVNASKVNENAGISRYIHFANGLIIEHVEIKAGQHRLTLLKDHNDILVCLKQYLRSDSKVRCTTNIFIISEEKLYEATHHYSQGDGKKGKALLQNSGLEPAEATALADALENTSANASFTVICNQCDPSSQHVRGFGILESKDQLWMMQPVDREGQHFVEFTPADGKSIRKQFSDILP